MNEWGVVGVLVALFGFGAAIVKPLLSLNTTMVKLTEAVKELQKDMSDFANGNHKSHVRIHERIDDCADELKKHENRIERLEHIREGK